MPNKCPKVESERIFSHIQSSMDFSQENLPFVLIHQLPRFTVSFNHWIQSKFRLLEPSDPDFPTLSKSVRVMLCMAPSPVTSDTLNQFPSLECVVGSTAGLDHIDLPECQRRNIRVTSAGEAYSEDVADYAVGLLIDVFRKVSAGDRFVRDGLWPVKGEYPLGTKLGGKRIGILGLGSIGSLIARRLESFGCIINYNSRKEKPNVRYTYYTNILDLASNSNALIVCCALTDETHHIINKDVMAALGKKGVIINVGRGALIDEKELVKFLLSGDIGGAGLDVFENEPSIPEELFVLDNVVLSPHRGIATSESFENLRELIVCNLEAFFENKPLRSEVKFE